MKGGIKRGGTNTKSDVNFLVSKRTSTFKGITRGVRFGTNLRLVSVDAAANFLFCFVSFCYSPFFTIPLSIVTHSCIK